MRAFIRPRAVIALVAAAVLFAQIFLLIPIAQATATVTAATGGSLISADTTGGTYTSLTGPVISEGAVADIGRGTIILNVPSGFIFDTGSTAPTVLLTRTGGSGSNSKNINSAASGSSLIITSITTTQITFTVTNTTSGGVTNSLTWQNVRVRPSAGTPLASGNITKSGTATIIGVIGSTNFGTLTEIVGAQSQLVIATQPSSSATVATDFATKPVVAVRDQFGNTVTSDSATTITRTAVLSTQSCGGTAGSGTLTSTPASGAAVSSGVITYTAMQYSAAESIKICFSSSGITSALSNAITVSAPPDTTAPAAIFDLALSGPSNSAMTVSWTTPGDDGSTGTATSYDLRYSTSLITSGNFSSATQVTGEPTPLVAGTSQSMAVTGLLPSTTYFFAIETSDEIPNTSAISNVPSLATTATPDTTAPAAISDLSASNATASSVDLSWTAPGDDGNTGIATTYDVRYSTATIIDSNWALATQASGEPTPQVAGTQQSMTVSGLLESTTYYFAMKTRDEAFNESSLSNVASNTTQVSPPPPPPPPPPGGPPPSEPAQPPPALGAGGVSPSLVSFSGRAYPGSKVEVLQKGSLDNFYTALPTATSSSILPDGTFSISYTGLVSTGYLFAIRVEDPDGRKTGIISFNANLQYGDLVVKDIFVPPTAGVNNSLVKIGTSVQVDGYAAPLTTVEIEINGIIHGKAKTDSKGHYSVSAGTQGLGIGTYYLKVRQTDAAGVSSQFSFPIAFKISSLINPKADFSGDGLVTITDWSVFLFRWGSVDQSLKSKIDMDGDGIIGISDFSIFLKAIKI